MPRAYSVDLRERSLRAVMSGMPMAEVVQVFGVSRSSLSRWRDQFRTTGDLAPGRASGRPRAIAPAQEAALHRQVATHPDATLAEHCAAWAASGGVRVSPTTMCRMFQRLALPLKKTLIATEQDPVARAAWATEIATWDAAQVVFLDETSTHTSLTRLRGRAPRGQRVVGTVPRRRGPNLTCLAALTATGIRVPLVIEGAMNGDVFLPWLRTWLLPSVAPGTTIVCDNLSVHRSPAVRQAVEAARCQLRFLPAYSPDFNPIERAFAKLKTHLRGAGSRTPDTLVAAMGEGCTAISAADARAWFRHSGYRFPHEEVQPL